MRRASIVAIVISTLALLGSLGVAQAQSDCKTLVKASPFGPDDQVGATNRITPAVTKAAAAEIQTGKVSDRLNSPVFAHSGFHSSKRGTRHQTDFLAHHKPRPRPAMTK